MRFMARQPIRTLNHIEWYMSKKSREVKIWSIAGLRRLANSAAPCSWGTTVPKMDTIANMIRSTIVSLTELKKPQMTFDRFFDFEFTIIIAFKKKKLNKPALRAFAGVRAFVDALPMKASCPNNTGSRNLQFQIAVQNV